MFSLFEKKNLTSEEFWRWFIKNKSKLEKFINSEHNDYSVYNKLTNQIKKYNKHLFPELTKTEDDKYVLIITPDGIKDGVEPTKKLAEASPEISNWVIKKFRQPIDDIGLNFNGVEYPASDIEILPQLVPEEEKIDINIFIRNMDKDQKDYQTLAFLYLDHIIGEFNSITKVRYIDFHHLDNGKSVKNSISLLQLRNLIEKELY
jgi:hypothetical protein